MNIDKIKNYNQKMLAVFSTILLITAAIGLILLIAFLVTEILPYRRDKANSLLSEEKIEQLNKDNLRQQLISYDSPFLIDTLNLVYLIPVNVNTLGKPEDINKNVMGLLDVSPWKGFGSSEKYIERFFYESFNNLLVFDFKKNTTHKICDRRLIGTGLIFRYFTDDLIISFLGAESDTDKDGQVTLNDLKSLFVYSLKEKNLREITINNSTVLSFEQILPYKDLLINFGLDRNKDDVFSEVTEPKFIMKYDFQSDSLIPIVGQNLESQIQKLIDKN